MKKLCTLLTILLCSNVYAQTDSVSTIDFMAYADVYYSYDFSKPTTHDKSYLYNYSRHNEVNANLFLIKGTYTHKSVRANLGLMAGTYTQANMVAEPEALKPIYEANIGVRLSSKKQLWLDAGIMPSHLGFESAVSADCPTLTRSMAAENSPYFETGLKLSYTADNQKFSTALLLLNGWQRIKRPDGMQRPSVGMQFTYIPSDKITFNYSNFIGSDKPDSLHIGRLFHNLYAQYNVSNNTSLTAGVDVGLEDDATWYTPILIIKHKLNKRWTAAFRGEYFSDKEQVLISTGTANGFQTLGLSTNADYAISDKVLFRTEARWMQAKDAIFHGSHQHFSITSNLSIKLTKKWQQTAIHAVP